MMIRKEAGLNFILKLTLWYCGIFAITAYGMYLFFHFQLEENQKEKQQAMIKIRVIEYLSWYQEGGLDQLKLNYEERLQNGLENFSLRVVKPGIEPHFDHFPKDNEELDLEFLDQQSLIGKDNLAHLRSLFKSTPWYIYTIPLENNYVLQIGHYAQEDFQFEAELKHDFIMSLLPFFLIGVIGGTWITHRSIQPIDQLGKTMRKILATGKWNQRVPITHKREDLNELVVLFNQLLDKNQVLIDGLHHSLDNVAHDIRTPMTRLRASAELALRESKNINAYQEALSDCLEESDTILNMLNLLMDVAEVEAGAMKLNFKKVSVTEIIKKVIDLYEFIAEDKNLRLHSQIPKNFELEADPVRLLQALSNLIDNAIKYIGKGNEIEIIATKENHRAQIVIKDNGMGISPEEHEKIWERLYRGDRSRSQKGLGIGLSLVKGIIVSHGGDIHLQSHQDQGSVFTLHLPLTRS